MKIVVFGANGRVGSQVCRLAEKFHTVIKVEKGNICREKADVCINFSVAEATEEVYNYCRTYDVPLVDGVTGRNSEQQRLIDNLAESVQVIHKDNFALGIGAIENACVQIAKILTNFDVEIVELHKKGKKDAPSGTAKMLAGKIARQKHFGTVTTHSLRMADAVGTHTVIFCGEGETLTLTHTATSVETFAKGALSCAETLVNKLKNNGIK